MLSGETQVYFAPVATALPHIKLGRLRALAVTTSKRVPLMPDLVTVAEAGFPGFQTSQWYGILVPTRTPRPVIAAIHEKTVAALNDGGVNKRLTDAGYIVAGNQPAEFKSHLKSEVDRLGALVRKLGLNAN